MLLGFCTALLWICGATLGISVGIPLPTFVITLAFVITIICAIYLKGRYVRLGVYGDAPDICFKCQDAYERKKYIKEILRLENLIIEQEKKTGVLKRTIVDLTVENKILQESGTIDGEQ